MKAAIVYFSGTGNTFRVGEVFKAYLENVNYQVDMIDISKHKGQLKGYDLFIAGTPTYTGTSPYKLNDFVENQITKSNNPKAHFITYVTHSWDTAFGHLTIKDFVTKKGFEVLGARAFLAPSNFYVYHDKEKGKPRKKEMHQLHQNIYKDVWNFMDAYVEGHTQIDKRSAFGKTKKVLLTKVMSKTFTPKFASISLKVDSEKCTQCKVCVNNCPNKNIELKNGKITFSKHCLSCTKCMHICPKNAYTFQDKPFEQYEVKQKPIMEQL